MESGNMATISPVSEDEMSKVQEVFAKMRDAVIDASHLAVEVATLRDSVREMQRDLENLRGTNRWMDTQITELRGQRDAAQRDATEAHAKASEYVQLFEAEKRHSENQRAELVRLNEQIGQLRKELHDREEDNLALEIENEELIKQLEAIKAVFSKPEVKEPEAPRPVEQPRDPVTQQWLPKTKAEQDREDAEAKQVEEESWKHWSGGSVIGG